MNKNKRLLKFEVFPENILFSVRYDKGLQLFTVYRLENLHTR